MNLSNNRGITLVELLGVLTIISIVSAIVWGVLINGQKASNMTKSNVSLQQYAHSFFLAIQSAHQLSDSYTISLDNYTKAQSITIVGDETITLNHPEIEFSFYIYDTNNQQQLLNNEITINANDQDFKFKIVFNHKNDPPATGNEEDPRKTFVLKTTFEKKSALTD
jgi:type II secretory pathway pseudopilin PulG